MNGAAQIVQQLKAWGTSHIFGLPGTQNAPLYSEFARQGLSSVASMHEMGAGFAALGYASVRHQPAVLALIGGPGFSYAVTPLLEALLDSIPLVCLVVARRPPSGRRFGSQEIDHVAIGRACCKEVLLPGRHDVLSHIATAWRISTVDEPGPVMVLIDADYLTADGQEALTAPAPDSSVALPVAPVCDHLNSSARRLFLAGRGALPAAESLRRLAERFGAAVITTTSARGVLPENHPHVWRTDLVPAEEANRFIAEFDQIVVWGAKLGYNGSKGFALRLPETKLIHIDAAAHVLNANYPARWTYQADVPSLLRAVDRHTSAGPFRSTAEPVSPAWRTLQPTRLPAAQTPYIAGVEPSSPVGFFASLRRILPHDAILVLDSGYHQNVARMCYPVYAPHGLLLPTGLQSMGYCLPVALGAALAQPHRRVVALLGDGGLRMSGMELLSFRHHQVPVVTIVFVDGYYGLIRQQQLDMVGTEGGVALEPMDYEAWAVSLQAEYFDGSDNPTAAIEEALKCPRASLVEIPLRDTLARQVARYKADLRGHVNRLRQQWRGRS